MFRCAMPRVAARRTEAVSPATDRPRKAERAVGCTEERRAAARREASATAPISTAATREKQSRKRASSGVYAPVPARTAGCRKAALISFLRLEPRLEPDCG